MADVKATDNTDAVINAMKVQVACALEIDKLTGEGADHSWPEWYFDRIYRSQAGKKT